MIIRNGVHLSRRIFFLTSILYAAYMGTWVGLITGSLWLGTTIGSAAGLVVGTLITFVIGALHQIASKRLKPDYIENLLAVHQVQVVTLQEPFEDAFETCLSSLLALKQCRIIQEDRQLGVTRALTGTTWKSFGEKILVTVSPVAPNSCRVTVSSKPAIGSTIVDYGKNVENIRSIVDALSCTVTGAKIGATLRHVC